MKMNEEIKIKEKILEALEDKPKFTEFCPRCKNFVNIIEGFDDYLKICHKCITPEDIKKAQEEFGKRGWKNNGKI